MSTWEQHLAEAREALRRSIQDAALRLIEGRGLPHTTMSAVAEAAGVSRQTLYNHYPDLESIMLDAARARIAQAAGMIESAMESAPDTRSALSVYIRGMLEGSEASDYAGMTGMSREAEEQVMEMLGPLQDLLEKLLREGIDDGSFRPELDPADVAEIVADVAEIVFHMIGSGRRLIQIGRDASRVAQITESLILRAVSA